MNRRKRFLILLLAAAAVCSAAFIIYKRNEKINYPIKYGETVKKYSEEYGVPESIVYSVIKTESNFKADAVSRMNALGLMQIIPSTFEWLSRLMKDAELTEDDYLDPETNIKYGVYYLGYLYKRFGNWDTALAGYNAGHGNVANWLADTRFSDDGVNLKEIPITETKNYVPKVNKAREKYKKLYEIE